MMKHIIVIFISFLCGYCHAQGYIDHTVQRGETLEFLAAKYGISEQDIRDQNEDFDLDILYVGLPLQIPIIDVNESSEDIERLIASNSTSSTILSEANILYNNGSYKKAIKLYTKAIEENATSDTYYLRGRCYLYQGKYKSAIKDLELANSGDLSYSLKTSCESLLTEAHNRRNAQLEARSETWGQVFAVAALTTAAVLDAKAASTANNASNSGASMNSNTEASTTSYNSSYNSSSSSSSSTSTTSTRQCTSCQNTKHCSQCRGTGYRTDNSYGTGQDPTKKCGICGGTGVCPKCKGTGRI